MDPDKPRKLVSRPWAPLQACSALEVPIPGDLWHQLPSARLLMNPAPQVGRPRLQHRRRRRKRKRKKLLLSTRMLSGELPSSNPRLALSFADRPCSALAGLDNAGEPVDAASPPSNPSSPPTSKLSLAERQRSKSPLGNKEDKTEGEAS